MISGSDDNAAVLVSEQSKTIYLYEGAENYSVQISAHDSGTMSVASEKYTEAGHKESKQP